MPAAEVHELLSAVHDGKMRPGRQVDVDVARVHHRRLIAAALKVLADSGYPDTTVAEIARVAQVSRRTFYEHFNGKDECLLAAYDAASKAFFRSISDSASAADNELPPAVRLMRGINAYLDGLMEEPTVFRVFQVEIIRMGPPARQLRRTNNDRWGLMLLTAFNEARAADPELRAISRELTLEAAAAAVAGIQELLLRADEDGRFDDPALRREVLLVLISAVSLDAGEYVDTLLAHGEVPAGWRPHLRPLDVVS